VPVFKIKNNNVTISCDFIENIMPELNGAYVKVYLYILMLASKGESAENADIAKHLGLLESEVKHAVEILSDCELISISDEVKSEKTTATKDVKVHYSVSEMTQELESNKSLADMLKIAQEVMGKPLNSTDTNTLFWFYDALGFSPEVILLLLEHCVSQDKRSMSYIEKVAIGWHDRGIRTIDDVEKMEAEAQESSSYFSSIKRIFGIVGRSLTNMEEKFLTEWKTEDNMSEEMVALAYEYCILQINKLSFPYINKIIKRWKASGIFTVEAAEKDNESFRTKAQDSTENDYTAIEKRMWDNL